MKHNFIFNIHDSINQIRPKLGFYDPRTEERRTFRLTRRQFVCVNCGEVFYQEDDNYPREHPEMLPNFPTPIFPETDCVPPIRRNDLLPPSKPKLSIWQKFLEFCKIK